MRGASSQHPAHSGLSECQLGWVSRRRCRVFKKNFSAHHPTGRSSVVGAVVLILPREMRRVSYTGLVCSQVHSKPLVPSSAEVQSSCQRKNFVLYRVLDKGRNPSPRPFSKPLNYFIGLVLKKDRTLPTHPFFTTGIVVFSQGAFVVIRNPLFRYFLLAQ